MYHIISFLNLPARPMQRFSGFWRMAVDPCKPYQVEIYSM